MTCSFDPCRLYLSGIRFAGLRSPAHVESAERRDARAPQDPWDPWPAQRIGYPDAKPAPEPSPEALARLELYLKNWCHESR